MFENVRPTISSTVERPRVGLLAAAPPLDEVLLVEVVVGDRRRGAEGVVVGRGDGHHVAGLVAGAVEDDALDLGAAEELAPDDVHLAPCHGEPAIRGVADHGRPLGVGRLTGDRVGIAAVGAVAVDDVDEDLVGEECPLLLLLLLLLRREGDEPAVGDRVVADVGVVLVDEPVGEDHRLGLELQPRGIGAGEPDAEHALVLGAAAQGRVLVPHHEVRVARGRPRDACDLVQVEGDVGDLDRLIGLQRPVGPDALRDDPRLWLVEPAITDDVLLLDPAPRDEELVAACRCTPRPAARARSPRSRRGRCRRRRRAAGSRRRRSARRSSSGCWSTSSSRRPVAARSSRHTTSDLPSP